MRALHPAHRRVLAQASTALAIFPALLLLSTSPLLKAQEQLAAGPKVEEIEPGIYQIGAMRLDKKRNTLSFPAKVNMNEGLLEYLIVGPEGSTHESLLVCDIPPTQLHFAMLLLGAKGAAGAQVVAPGVPSQLNADYLRAAPQLRGESITITAFWDQNGTRKSAPIEDWLRNPSTKKAAARGPWTYSGSTMTEGHLRAELDHCIASLVTNPAALINNPRPESNDDTVWEPAPKKVPKPQTLLQIVLQLPLPTAPSPAPAPNPSSNPKP